MDRTSSRSPQMESYCRESQNSTRVEAQKRKRRWQMERWLPYVESNCDCVGGKQLRWGGCILHSEKLLCDTIFGMDMTCTLQQISFQHVIRCRTLLEDLWTTWRCCLYVFYYYHILSYSLCSIFISVYMVLFLFNNVIYVFLLLWLCILLCVYVWLPWLMFFLAFFLSCKANARVKPTKMGHSPHSS